MAVDYQSNPYVFDRIVTVLQQWQIRDSYNNAKSVWHPFAIIRASLEPLTGREYWVASQSQAEGTIKLTMRYRRGITDQMRFQYETQDGLKTLEVKSPPINILEQNKYLVIMCRELIEQKGL